MLAKQHSTLTQHCIQGVLIRRHRIEKSDGSFFAPGDFVVGDNVSLYGRTFHIVDADVFTRQTMADAGLEYGLAEQYPDDPFTTKRLSMQRHGSGQFFAQANTSNRSLFLGDFFSQQRCNSKLQPS